MKLRHKFGVLALIYVLSLCGNLVMSGWCIVTYFQSAFVEVQSSFVRQAEIERLRLQTHRALEIQARAGRDLPRDELRALAKDLAAWAQMLRREGGAHAPMAPWAELDRAVAAALREPEHAPWERVDHLLSRVSSGITSQRRMAIEQAAATQQKVVGILIVNAAFGACLCMVGLVLVRRWVLVPVAGLRAATQQISRGDFDYRIRPRSGDELGQLAEEVNHMTATIVQMQEKLVEQERLAAAGEMVTRIAHNIRNPLAGIRGLAEATAQQPAGGNGTTEYQRRIIESVDRLEQWLRELQQSVTPMRLNPQPVEIAGLIEQVRTVLVPMADRKRVRIEVEVDPAARTVQVDGFHFEQALVALLTNAIQASRAGQVVRVAVRPVSPANGRWCLSVEDEGEGIPKDLRAKVFLPYFTTRPDGNGVGLAMAAKVVKSHGGRITVASESGQGTRFDAIMPGLANAEK